MNNIQAKLTVTILVIFFIAMSTLGGLNYWKARNIIIENVTNDIQKQAVDSARDVSESLESCRRELSIIASNPVVASNNPEVIIPLLAAAKNTGSLTLAI